MIGESSRKGVSRGGDPTEASSRWTLGSGSSGGATEWRAGGTDSELLKERLEEAVRELDDCGEELVDRDPRRELFAVVDDPERNYESVRDGLSTRLMEYFRIQGGRACFGLLYELNSQQLYQQVAGRLRRYQSKADPHDVLQEVFVNIYRYPHRFNSERDDAFRVWTATIVRNTVLKHLRSLSRSGRAEVPFEDLSDHPEPSSREPVRGAMQRESEAECARVYLTYLHLYLQFYTMLSERERQAIHLVEVENRSYREAADELSIKLENLKMVIFRARRKIHRSMKRVFEGLPPDIKPARDPRLAGSGAAADMVPVRRGPGTGTRKVVAVQKRPSGVGRSSR